MRQDGIHVARKQNVGILRKVTHVNVRMVLWIDLRIYSRSLDAFVELRRFVHPTMNAAQQQYASHLAAISTIVHVYKDTWISRHLAKKAEYVFVVSAHGFLNVIVLIRYYYFFV